jgi:hypothetical protein
MSASAGRLARRARLQNGLTAHETWQRVMGKKCTCGRWPDMGARVFYPTDDLVKDKPDVAMRMAAKNGGRIPVVQFRGPGNTPVPFTGIANYPVCSQCSKNLATFLAQEVPSYAVVEWYYGPGSDPIQVQVA